MSTELWLDFTSNLTYFAACLCAWEGVNYEEKDYEKGVLSNERPQAISRVHFPWMIGLNIHDSVK